MEGSSQKGLSDFLSKQVGLGGDLLIVNKKKKTIFDRMNSIKSVPVEEGNVVRYSH
jgi:hypothetical protein